MIFHTLTVQCLLDSIVHCRKKNTDRRHALFQSTHGMFCFVCSFERLYSQHTYHNTITKRREPIINYLNNRYKIKFQNRILACEEHDCGMTAHIWRLDLNKQRNMAYIADGTWSYATGSWPKSAVLWGTSVLKDRVTLLIWGKAR